MSDPILYGVVAQFVTATELVDAVGRIRQQDPDMVIEAYSPFPISELDATLGGARNPIPACMAVGAMLGGVGTFALEWYSAVIDYPLNVGGRPTDSWPAFIPPAIEMAVLWAVIAGVITMLICNHLPMLHHPLFGLAPFGRASADRFFLVLRGADGEAARALLTSVSPVTIDEVFE